MAVSRKREFLADATGGTVHPQPDGARRGAGEARRPPRRRPGRSPGARRTSASWTRRPACFPRAKASWPTCSPPIPRSGSGSSGCEAWATSRPSSRPRSGSAMRYEELEPPAQLRQLVHRIWMLRGAGAPGGAPFQRAMPDGRAELIFNLADPFECREGAGLGGSPWPSWWGPTAGRWRSGRPAPSTLWASGSGPRRSPRGFGSAAGSCWTAPAPSASFRRCWTGLSRSSWRRRRAGGRGSPSCAGTSPWRPPASHSTRESARRWTSPLGTVGRDLPRSPRRWG